MPKNLPIKYHPETFLDMVTILPYQALQPTTPNHRFPGCIAPITPYLSLLPPDRMGLERAAERQIVRPKDVAGLSHPDVLEVDRTLYLAFDENSPSQWSIVWCVPNRRIGDFSCLRTLTIDESCNANFGPFTSFDKLTTLLTPHTSTVTKKGTVFLPISDSRLTLTQRRDMEMIAWSVGTLPYADYNSRNWVVAVLCVAVSRGLFELEAVHNVITEAFKAQPTGTLREIPLDGF
jgi:hypothetical protein